jgi:hypothetical protein
MLAPTAQKLWRLEREAVPMVKDFLGWKLPGISGLDMATVASS